MKKFKIYEIKQKSAENAKKLLSSDGKYFYWNDAKFLKNEIDDIVFIVNKHEKWSICSKISKKDIKTRQNDNKASFTDESQSYTVNDPEKKYKTFIRFERIEKKDIPYGWKWNRQLGQSETYDLVKKNITEKENRIDKINDLKKIFNNGNGLEILNQAADFLENAGDSTNIIKPEPILKTDTINDMNIITAIKTKPFILLAGISGTGKSRLARTLAYQTCAKQELRSDPKKPGNFELIPVRPNWHDSSELMGYISRINGEKYITTAFLKFVAKAWKHPDIPFFLCLDEMNLAPVEQYFAEYLSIIETRQNISGEIITDYLLSKSDFENINLYNQILKDLGLENNTRFIDGIGIPNNLVIIGTVNMDETTHSFSRKVLDRAMTFEMNEVNLKEGLDKDQNDWDYPESSKFIRLDGIIGKYTAGADVYNQSKDLGNKVIEFLEKINSRLDGTPFKIAYRVRDEFLIYCYYAYQDSQNRNIQQENWFENAMDEMICMKILSRIEGDENRTAIVLRDLQKDLTPDHKKSNAKLKEMEARLQNSGYTSFWS